MYNDTIPTMLTIREAAKIGPLKEHALRLLLAQGKLPGLWIGRKFLVNLGRLCRMLDGEEGEYEH